MTAVLPRSPAPELRGLVCWIGQVRGLPRAEIAARLEVARSTVWRRCAAFEALAAAPPWRAVLAAVGEHWRDATAPWVLRHERAVERLLVGEVFPPAALAAGRAALGRAALPLRWCQTESGGPPVCLDAEGQALRPDAVLAALAWGDLSAEGRLLVLRATRAADQGVLRDLRTRIALGPARVVALREAQARLIAAGGRAAVLHGLAPPPLAALVARACAPGASLAQVERDFGLPPRSGLGALIVAADTLDDGMRAAAKVGAWR